MPCRWVIWSQCCLEMSGSKYPLKKHNIPDGCNPQLQSYEKTCSVFCKRIYNKTRLNKTCPLQNQVTAFPRQQCVLAFVRRIRQHTLNKQNRVFKYTDVACITIAFNYSSTSPFHYPCTSLNLVLTAHTVNGHYKLHYQTVKATKKRLRSHSLTLL
jgi:hypothetical protein